MGGRLVLIISTSLQFRSLVAAELMERGYEVEGAETIGDSLRVWGSGKSPVVLLDAQGQELGESTLAIVAGFSRRAVVVVCAGAFDLPGEDWTRYGVKRVIRKPVTVGEIVDEISLRAMI